MATEALTLKEVYTNGHEQSVVSSHAKRTAETCAAFLLEKEILDSEKTRLLDVGCGPGSISAGLAKYCARIDAIDYSSEVVELAQQTARDLRVENKLHVRAGSIYELPYEDGSFDVVYAHMVLQHLADPVGALQEMQRVLKPGGFVAVRESDFASMLSYPYNAGIDNWRTVHRLVCHSNKAQPDAGRYLKDWATQAGFKVDNIKISFSITSYTTPNQCKEWGTSWQQRVLHSSFAKQAQEYGHATLKDLQEMSDGWALWADQPGACFYFVNGELLACKR